MDPLIYRTATRQCSPDMLGRQPMLRAAPSTGRSQPGLVLFKDDEYDPVDTIVSEVIDRAGKVYFKSATWDLIEKVFVNPSGMASAIAKDGLQGLLLELGDIALKQVFDKAWVPLFVLKVSLEPNAISRRSSIVKQNEYGAWDASGRFYPKSPELGRQYGEMIERARQGSSGPFGDNDNDGGNVKDDDGSKDDNGGDDGGIGQGHN